MTNREKTGFHAGELAVQEQAGVSAQAARLEGMLAPADLRGGLGRFLADRTYAALTARDLDGRLWVSPLAGDPGFLAVAGPTRLEIGAAPRYGDPLHGLRAGQSAGLIVIDYVARRRVRINGELVAASADELVVEAREAYGNCPQYIPSRPLRLSAQDGSSEGRIGVALSEEDASLVASVDTVVLGTTHPDRGNDASHRGGAPGFLGVESPTRVGWDDLPGNQMFNSLGNLAVDPEAALLLVDPVTGRTLHLSGRAAVDWSAPGSATGRRVVLDVEAVVSG